MVDIGSAELKFFRNLRHINGVQEVVLLDIDEEKLQVCVCYCCHYYNESVVVIIFKDSFLQCRKVGVKQNVSERGKDIIYENISDTIKRGYRCTLY